MTEWLQRSNRRSAFVTIPMNTSLEPLALDVSLSGTNAKLELALHLRVVPRVRRLCPPILKSRIPALRDGPKRRGLLRANGKRPLKSITLPFALRSRLLSSEAYRRVLAASRRASPRIGGQSQRRLGTHPGEALPRKAIDSQPLGEGGVRRQSPHWRTGHCRMASRIDSGLTTPHSGMA